MIVTPIDHLFTLQRSPIGFAPVVHTFFASSAPRDRDILLSYLVVPMVLHPPMRKYLLASNKRSNLRTMCQSQARLIGLVENVHRSKKLTNSALLVLKAEKLIEVSDVLTVRSIGEVNKINAKSEFIEAARKLAAILDGLDVVTIYRMLGFKTL